MNKKTGLWLKNNSGSDVSLSDLGVKVPKGKTINVFKYNPYLTADQVKQSLTGGSLSKRLANKVLIPVGGPSNERPNTLDHIKQSDEAVSVKKTKTSVLVEPGNPDLEDDGEQEGFNFADYGINDIGPVEHKREGESVLVEAKQDPDPEEDTDAELKPVQSKSPASEQSVVTMQTQQKASSHPMGKMAQTSNQVGEDQPFVVSKPPVDDNESKPEPEPKQQEIKPHKEGNVVTPQTGKVAAERDLKLVRALDKKAEELGVKVDDLPEEVVIEVEAEVIGEKIIKDEAKEEFDSQVATQTSEGATVMRLKEVDEKDTSK